MFGLSQKKSAQESIPTPGGVTPPPPPGSHDDDLADMPDAPMPGGESAPNPTAQESPSIPADAFEPQTTTFASAPPAPAMQHLPTQEPVLDSAPEQSSSPKQDFTQEPTPQAPASPKPPTNDFTQEPKEQPVKTAPMPELKPDASFTSNSQPSKPEQVPNTPSHNPEHLRKAIEQSIKAPGEESEEGKKLKPRNEPTLTQDDVSDDVMTAPQKKLQHPKEIDPRDRFDDLITGENNPEGTSESIPESNPEPSTFTTEPTGHWGEQTSTATKQEAMPGTLEAKPEPETETTDEEAQEDYNLPSFDKNQPVQEVSTPGPRTVEGALFLSVEDYERVLTAARGMTKGLNKGYDDLQAIESSNKTKKAQFTRLHNELDEIQESLMIVDARLFETSTKVIS